MKDCGLEDGSGSYLLEYALLIVVLVLAMAATLSYLGVDLRTKYYQIIAQWL
jgi:Flp pilus assembly pilin Flp